MIVLLQIDFKPFRISDWYQTHRSGRCQNEQLYGIAIFSGVVQVVELSVALTLSRQSPSQDFCLL